MGSERAFHRPAEDYQPGSHGFATLAEDASSQGGKFNGTFSVA
jgi:hypothetical protein